MSTKLGRNPLSQETVKERAPVFPGDPVQPAAPKSAAEAPTQTRAEPEAEPSGRAPWNWSELRPMLQGLKMEQLALLDYRKTGDRNRLQLLGMTLKFGGRARPFKLTWGPWARGKFQVTLLDLRVR